MPQLRSNATPSVDRRLTRRFVDLWHTNVRTGVEGGAKPGVLCWHKPGVLQFDGCSPSLGEMSGGGSHDPTLLTYWGQLDI